MAAGSRHLQGALNILLAHNILKIRNMEFLPGGYPNRLFRQLGFTIEGSNQLGHRMNAIDRRAAGQSCLSRILRRNEQSLDTRLLCRQRHRQHTADRTDGSLQTHLTDEGTGGTRTTD